MRWLILPYATSALMVDSKPARQALVAQLASSEIPSSGLLGSNSAFPASMLEIDNCNVDTS
jgi:hypothetical protein